MGNFGKLEVEELQDMIWILDFGSSLIPVLELCSVPSSPRVHSVVASKSALDPDRCCLGVARPLSSP